MKRIANYKDIDIISNSCNKFTFFKSPYAAHKTFSAVDIYYNSNIAPSPVWGEIIDIREYNTPTYLKNNNSKEYLIAIEQGDYVVKIMHIKPCLEIGEKVHVGDRLGEFIRNGYFCFWNDLCMHVECRDKNDYIRASNNKRLNFDIGEIKNSMENNEFFEGEVIQTRKNYALISADYATDGKINGFAINGYFLDGFIPLNQDYYLNYYGIISKDYCSTLENNNIEMQIYSGNQSISALGLAFSLSFNKPLIKIIPLQYREYFLKEGDIIKLKINLKW